jgi:hypothetical protein
MTESQELVREPLLTKIAKWPCLVGGSLFVFVSLVTALGCSDTSRLEGSPLGVPLWVAGTFITGALVAAIGYGFKYRKPWSGTAVIAYWLVTGGSSILNSIASGLPIGAYFVSLISLLGITISWWYFFRKNNVVAYFRLNPRASDAALA